MRNLYGVFYVHPGTNRPMWGLRTNKRAALKDARQHAGYVVIVPNAYGYGSVSSWDAPTFKVTGTRIADFREVSK